MFDVSGAVTTLMPHLMSLLQHEQCADSRFTLIAAAFMFMSLLFELLFSLYNEYKQSQAKKNFV